MREGILLVLVILNEVKNLWVAIFRDPKHSEG
jgi:hypothetical protein